MPFYRYQAVGEEGKKISAIIDAENLQDAKQKLIKRQIVVIQIKEVDEKELSKPLGKSDVLAITRELARLLQAGLPLFEALSALEEKYRNQKSHKTLLDLCEGVKTGHSFSRALSRHQTSFDVLYISMVANAEKTGKLGECLEELSKLMEKSLRLRKQVLSALLYPSLLAVFCLVVLSSLLFFVIPS
ncbi:MAG: type II secretion system F family protein, partial [Chlamydiae bacterium]|nr:type II secretion system F family protein [Chlamydiota bacterium]